MCTLLCYEELFGEFPEQLQPLFISLSPDDLYFTVIDKHLFILDVFLL